MAGTSRWKRALPWIGTVLLLGYLGWTTDFETALNALADVSIAAVLALALAGTLVTFTTDSWCVALAFSRFVCPVRLREALPIKATSYFLNLLNYSLALVGMGFYLQRSRGASFWRALGSLFFINLTDIVALCLLLAAGLLATWGSDTLAPPEVVLAWTVVGGGIGGFAFLALACRFDMRIPLLNRIVKFELLRPLAEADVSTVARFVALRGFFLLQYLASQYIFLHLFGIHVPLVRMLVYLPLLTFIQIIPISISGLGTTQLVMRHFYVPYVAAAAGAAAGVVDACSTTSILAFVLFRIIVGYLFLGDLSREVIRGAGKAGRP